MKCFIENKKRERCHHATKLGLLSKLCWKNFVKKRSCDCRRRDTGSGRPTSNLHTSSGESAKRDLHGLERRRLDKSYKFVKNGNWNRKSNRRQRRRKEEKRMKG